MKITKAVYLESFAEKDQLKLSYPNQIAFAGRSNVGKSSILNSLLNRKNLAKTSATPGKTRMVNVYSINNTLHFVDLPGFGYAKVPKSMRNNWKDLVEAYLLGNPHLKGMVLIIDVRRGLQTEELAFMAWLQVQKIPVLLVINKTDKLKKRELNHQLRRIKEILTMEFPDDSNIQIIPYSARKGTGKPDLWRGILTLTGSP